jgi:hypothetical protein
MWLLSRWYAVSPPFAAQSDSIFVDIGPFKSQRDLKQHLSEVSRHIVLTCCHKFFNMPAHFEQHIKANPPVGMQNHFDRYISAKKVKDGRGA